MLFNLLNFTLCVLSCVRLFATPRTIASHVIFQAKDIGLCCHFLLQGIFPTQGLNMGIPWKLS